MKSRNGSLTNNIMRQVISTHSRKSKKKREKQKYRKYATHQQSDFRKKKKNVDSSFEFVNTPCITEFRFGVDNTCSQLWHRLLLKNSIRAFSCAHTYEGCEALVFGIQSIRFQYSEKVRTFVDTRKIENPKNQKKRSQHVNSRQNIPT